MKRLLNVFLFGAITGCSSNSHSDGVIVLSSEVMKPIRIMLKDSLYYHINFDTAGNISSVLPYRAGILEGNAYEFYANGILKKRMELHSGKLDGMAQYFHESGTLWKQIYFRRELSEFSKIVYWDSIVPIVRYIYEADSTGNVNNIKTFNHQGILLKDSIPPKGEQMYPE